ncbi:MAG: NAD(P)-dependent oxidoreductase [Dehalococcoidia bacterium]|nr:NAD(P)-dependent oxidoreductase [Dehalococcoidia bacterium]
MKIGFIGIGNMGEPMSTNLRRGGYEVVVHNRSPRPSIQRLIAEGADMVFSAAEIAKKCDIVCTCVTLPKDTDDVYLGENGLVHNARKGQIFVEHSTIGPAQARKIAQECHEKGAVFLDAPVSGGVVGATNATLTIMVGGDNLHFEHVRPILEKMGKNVMHVGGTGAGCIIKLINQYILAINQAALTEGFILAKKSGVDPKVAFEVIKTSSGSSATLTGTFPRIIARDFQTRFALKLLLKDVRLAMELADQQYVRSMAGTAARKMLEEADAQGLGDMDFPAMVMPLEKMTGVELK